MPVQPELKPEVIETVRNALVERGYTDIKIEVEPGSAKGDNYLGIITKANIHAKTKSGQQREFSWIVKSAAENEAFRKVMRIQNIFLREIYVYNKVLPEFKKLQEDAAIAKSFDNYPRIQATYAFAPESVVMEDMKQLGFVMKDRQKPLDYNHTMLAMKEYGRFHALSFALRAKNPEVFEQLSKDMNENFFTPSIDENINKNLTGQTDKVFKALKPQDTEAIKRLKIYADKPFNKIRPLLQAKTAGDYAVFGHGDSWVNNILYKYENKSTPEVPTSLCFLDFQLSRLGSPALDLSYFLFTCTNGKLRANHYDELLQTYHKSLSDFLKEFSLDSEQLFPYNVLIDHMKKFSLNGLMMTIMVMHLMLSEQDEIPDLESLRKEDGQMDLTFDYKCEHEDVFGERIREVVLDFVAKKYL